MIRLLAEALAKINHQPIRFGPLRLECTFYPPEFEELRKALKISSFMIGTDAIEKALRKHIEEDPGGRERYERFMEERGLKP